MMPWFDRLAEYRREGTSCVLITVVSANGSTPREAGTKMITTQRGQSGTIGGGALEYEAVARARALLSAGASVPVLEEVPLGPALGQCCGGRVQLLYEPQLPVLDRLLLFGAGHVGNALIEVLHGLPLAIDWIDTRADLFPASIREAVRMVPTTAPLDTITQAATGTHVLIMTHDHALDLELVRKALLRDDLGFIGLIGSASKRARFERQLRAEGLTEAFANRLVSPIGIDGIHGKHPREIAIATAAQLLSHGIGATITPAPTGTAA
jgi:xanthine dehydrogenase accessory factor